MATSRVMAGALLALLTVNVASGQTLTNGFDQADTLVLGTTNTYTFYATNGDTILLRVGAPFRPLLTVHAPNGTTLTAVSGSGSSSIDAATTPLTVTTNGWFSAQVSSYYRNGSGDYLLCLAQIPADHAVATTDEGGWMTNGAEHPGTNSLGDLDIWRIAAAAGDRIVVRMGATGFRPYLLLYGPNGAQVDLGAGAGSGDTDALVEAQATNAAIFTVVAQSYYPNGTGPYTIRLAKSTGSFVVSPGDEGGDLINGASTPGQIAKGDLDLWRFEAAAGDNITIRMGSPEIRPWLRLYGPTGVLFRENSGGTSGARDSWVSGRVTNTGTYLLLAQSYYYSLSSPYTLTLAKMPGSYTVASGDEGGPMTNGLAHLATNSVGDLDVWTFTAQAGDNIALRVGAPEIRPWLQLYGPDGVLIREDAGATSAYRDSSIFFQATNSGVFTVLQQSYYGNGTGPYTLHFGRFPGAYFVSSGDEGGRLSNGMSYDAAVTLGDLDLWNLAACKGFPFTVVCQKLSGNFTPRIRLYARNGALLTTVQNANTATLNYPGTHSGNYTIMVDSAVANTTGTYQITPYGIYEDGLRLCPPLVSANSANVTGYGGIPSQEYVLLTTTNLAASTVIWTPVLTNDFDAFGGLDYTNHSGGDDVRRFFQLRTP